MPDVEAYLSKYPWYSEARETVGDFDRSRIFEDAIKERAYERVKQGINDGEVGPPLAKRDGFDTESEANAAELLSYPAARLLVSVIDDTRITNRYARAEAETARKRLNGDLESPDAKQYAEDTTDDPLAKLTSTKEELTLDDLRSEFDLTIEELPRGDYLRSTRSYATEWLADQDQETLETVATDVFHLGAHTVDDDLEDASGTDIYRHFATEASSTSPAFYTLPVTEFIPLAASISEPEWRLLRRDVTDGELSLRHPELLELLEQAIYLKVRDRLPLSVPDEIAEDLAADAAKLEDALDDEFFTYDIDRVEPGNFPPVMDYLLEEIQQGNHLKHEARFAIAAFLVNIGMSTDDIVEMFGVNDTFAEEPTRYQVDHIRNGGGDGEPYTPPTYATMETWGLEWERDALEQEVKHPLTYYRVKLRDEEEGDADNADEDASEEEETSEGESGETPPDDAGDETDAAASE